jgi:hypothetical protein
LDDLYGFYRRGESMLTGIYRDEPTLPEPIRARLADDDRRHRELLLEPFELDRPSRRRVRALIGHAVSFLSWRSLCLDQRLSNEHAVEDMVALVFRHVDG